MPTRLSFTTLAHTEQIRLVIAKSVTTENAAIYNFIAVQTWRQAVLGAEVSLTDKGALLAETGA